MSDGPLWSPKEARWIADKPLLMMLRPRSSSRIWDREYPGTMRVLIDEAYRRGLISDTDRAQIVLGVWHGPAREDG